MYEPLEELTTLQQKESHTWQISIDNEVLGTPDEEIHPIGEKRITISGLGAGTYAFSIVGELQTSENEWVPVGVWTTFRLPNNEISVVPSPNTTVEGKDDTIYASDLERDSETKYQLEGERTASATNSISVVPEWCLRQEGLRNTVPYLVDDATKARYETDDAIAFAPDGIEDTVFDYRDTKMEFRAFK